MRKRWIAAPGLVALALSACSVPSTPSSSASSPIVSGGTASAPPTPSASASPAQPSGTPFSPTPAASGPASPSPRLTDAPRATPYVVNGIVLVNQRHPLASGYVPAWADESDGLAPEFRAALKLMQADAAKRGLTLAVRSGYRSYAAQKASYENALETYDRETAVTQFAAPGTSEHQTGLACDLSDASGGPGYEFKRTPEAAYVAQHATDFGFIVRYPENGRAITGYIWEPWHIRYVGPQVAAYFAAHPGLTLEEYLGDA